MHTPILGFDFGTKLGVSFLGFHASIDIGQAAVLFASLSSEQFKVIDVREDLSWSYMNVYGSKKGHKDTKLHLAPIVSSWIREQKRLQDVKKNAVAMIEDD